MIRPCLQATFRYETLVLGDLEYVLVEDCDIGRSVTNDAAAVITFLSGKLGGLGGRPVIYRDTAGRWDCLGHDAERFTGFVGLDADSEVDALERLPTPVPGATGYRGI